MIYFYDFCARLGRFSAVGGANESHHGNDGCGVGGGVCVGARRNSRTIPTVENLWGRGVLFLPEPIVVHLL